MTYTELSQLQQEFGSLGFSVMAFPTNDFRQELPTNEEIQSFVHERYPQATFPVLGLTSLHNNPVYQSLQQQMPEAHVRHNFYKYLVNRNGVAVKFYPKQTDPLELREDIAQLLDETNDERPKQRLVTH